MTGTDTSDSVFPPDYSVFSEACQRVVLAISHLINSKNRQERGCFASSRGTYASFYYSGHDRLAIVALEPLLLTTKEVERPKEEGCENRY